MDVRASSAASPSWFGVFNSFYILFVVSPVDVSLLFYGLDSHAYRCAHTPPSMAGRLEPPLPFVSVLPRTWDHHPYCPSIHKKTSYSSYYLDYSVQTMPGRVEDYKVVRAVGKGSFGKVYLVHHTKEKKHYCMKCIKLTNIPKKERDACRHEVKLMQRLAHPNIVGFKDSFFAKRGDQLCIVMTYCDGGDLSDRVKQQSRTGRRFREDQVMNWFVQICLGLHAMHDNNILHRDLKTQNIFLLGNGRLVLGDLGISKVLEGTMDFAKTCIGTPYYMSPELFKNQPYNHKSDVWAVGCILYELCTLKHAFDANSLNGLSSKILRGYYPPVDKKFSSATRELVKTMLSLHPSQRPSIHEVLRSSKIKKHIANFMSDICARPKNKIGDGTMVVRRAVLKVAGENLGATMARLDSNAARDVTALIAQLRSLGLDSVVRKAMKAGDEEEVDAMEPLAGHGVPPSPAPHSRVPVQSRRSAMEERQRKERERLAALRREEERKRAVKAALEKLRKEKADRLAMKRRVEERSKRVMAGNRYGLGGGGAGAARAARQRYRPPNPSSRVDHRRGPVRGAAPRSRNDVLAVARERSKQLEDARKQRMVEHCKELEEQAVARRRKLAEQARKNQEDAERRVKERQERAARHQQEDEGKSAAVDGVRALDDWDARQKKQKEKFQERRAREFAAMERRKKEEEDRVSQLKAKWKEENDRMGEMLERAKKKREERAQREKDDREAKARKEKSEKLEEKRRQEEMARAVKAAKERREAEKEQERLALQARDEGVAARRRLVEQQRKQRIIAATAAPNSAVDRDERFEGGKPVTQPVEDRREAMNDRESGLRRNAWGHKDRRPAKGIAVKSIFPRERRGDRARTPSPPASPAATMQRQRSADDGVFSTRDQVLARKRERQRAKDEETRQRLAVARREVQRDRERAKEAAQQQRLTSVKMAVATGLSPSPSKQGIEDLADEALERHEDLALAADMPGPKYSDEEEDDENDSAITEDILCNTRLHEEHPIFDNSSDDGMLEVDESLEEEDDATATEEVDENAGDEDDDEELAFAEREEELEEELKMATQRCHTLRRTLLESRGQGTSAAAAEARRQRESKYNADGTPVKLSGDSRQDSPYGYEEDGFEVYSDEDASEPNSYDDSGDGEDENPQSAYIDNVPPSDAPSNYVSQIQMRRQSIRQKCVGILGDVRFEAAFGVVQERYRRCERGDEGAEEDDEAVFKIAMQNLLGPDYRQLYQDLEQLVLIEEGYM